MDRSDWIKARKYFLMACDKGIGTACGGVGLMEENLGRHTEARSYFEKACHMESTYDCLRMSYLISPSEAEMGYSKYLQKACDLNEEHACFFLAIHYEKIKNSALAIKHYLKACEGNLQDGCVYAGLVLGMADRNKESFEVMQRACLKSGEQDPGVCLIYGQTSLDFEPEESRRVCEKMCKARLGLPDSCICYGNALVALDHESEGFQLLEQRYPEKQHFMCDVWGDSDESQLHAY